MTILRLPDMGQASCRISLENLGSGEGEPEFSEGYRLGDSQVLAPVPGTHLARRPEVTTPPSRDWRWACLDS